MNDNSNQSLVSVIVPIYNVEKYLKKSINSIITQDYKNLEIILVNDGSPDDSISICRNFAKLDSRIIVIDKKNGGVSSARNLGLKKAKGKYIVFVDADDWLEKNFISYMVKLIEDNSCDFGLSVKCFKYDNEDDDLVDNVTIMNSTDATALLLSMKLDVGCWNKIFLKKILDNNEIKFDENLFFGEGLNFITKVSQLSQRIAVSNKKLYHYRQDNLTSATKKYDYKKIINGEKALDVIKENLINKDKKIIEQLNIHYFFFFYNAVITTCINNKKIEYKEEFKYWRRKAKEYYKIVKRSKEISIKTKIKSWIQISFPMIFMILRKGH